MLDPYRTKRATCYFIDSVEGAKFFPAADWMTAACTAANLGLPLYRGTGRLGRLQGISVPLTRRFKKEF